MRLASKVALVTGGGSGIGRAIATRFAQEGACVAVADLRRERADEVAQEIVDAGGEALPVAADVASGAAVEALVEQVLRVYDHIDILVNNAAMSRGDDLREIDEATWDFNLSVVLKSAFLCAKAVLPGMIARRRGAIVNIASVNGLAALGEEGYSAAKAGMISLTQNMGVKYGQYNVRANCICPGTVRTPIWQARVERDPQIFDRLAKWYPLGRVGEPADIANAALFLASDEAAWVTGATLVVDGGLLAGNYRMTRELEAKDV
jgi:meso-butanediol dehydrogenase / (S,S)-butanediol dehydrogenase / diacetyl reductase